MHAGHLELLRSFKLTGRSHFGSEVMSDIWGHPKEGLWGSDPPSAPNPYERHFQAQAVSPVGQEAIPGQVLTMNQEVKPQGLQQQPVPGQFLPGQALPPALPQQAMPPQAGIACQQAFGGPLPGQPMPAPFSQVPGPTAPAPGSFAPGLSPGPGFGGVSPIASMEPRTQFPSHSTAFQQPPGNPPFAGHSAPFSAPAPPQSFAAPFSTSGFSSAAPDLGFSSAPGFSSAASFPPGGSFTPATAAFGALGGPPEASETRNCSCGVPSQLLSVKKEGPNQGRQFFRCGKEHPEQPCGFFEWADEPPRPPGQAAQGQSMLPPGPPCSCGVPSITLTVKKSGPNQGRQFFKCTLA